MKKNIFMALIAVLLIANTQNIIAKGLKEVSILNSITCFNKSVNVNIYGCNSDWNCIQKPVATFNLPSFGVGTLDDNALSMLMQLAMRKTKNEAGTYEGCPRFIVEARVDNFFAKHYTVVLDKAKVVKLDVTYDENGIGIQHVSGSKHEKIVNQIAKQNAQYGNSIVKKDKKPLILSNTITNYFKKK